MNSHYDRKDFLKLAGLAGAGLLAGPGRAGSRDPHAPPASAQPFNMHAYAAPRLETVRVGFIGVGNRGSGHVRRFARVEGVQVKAICDIIPEKVRDAINSISEYPYRPDGYSRGEEDWKRMCERDDIDLVIIATPWALHTPQAVYAMEQGKHVGVEVPTAKTLEECWQLVETSEKTRRHCMILENACYGDFQMLALQMARQGFFGEVIHGEGAYIHDLLERYNFNKGKYENNWRVKENIDRNGNLYPTHGLGTICQVMNINYGDQMDYMVSMSSNDFMMGEMAEKMAAEDDFWKPFVGRDYRGNMNTSTIRTKKGRTIMLQHDVTSPRPNVRFNIISGTKAIAQQYPRPARIATSHEGWLPQPEYDALAEQYRPEIGKRIGEMARQIGGHGGIDMIMTWRLIDCLRNGIPLDMDVYDAALWSCITPLSEWSVANRSNSVDVPDFTRGAWRTNTPNMDIELKRGGTTGLI